MNVKISSPSWRMPKEAIRAEEGYRFISISITMDLEMERISCNIFDLIARHIDKNPEDIEDVICRQV